MLRIFMVALLGCLFSTNAFSQLLDWSTNNEYRGPENASLYWKNRKPRADYWQQDVYYQIRAELNEEKEIIKGEMVLKYYNNSPDTLTQAFFHLYQNSYQPGTLSEETYKANKTAIQFGKYEAKNLGTSIELLMISQKTSSGEKTKIITNPTIYNTIMQCDLAQALAPGEYAEFRINFTTYFDRGSLRRRMKVYDHDGVKHFNTVHWYPRISVYDAKFSWETAQHIDHEFYGDFGQYDVELILPKKYIVEATGIHINRKDIYDEQAWNNVQIANFANRKKGDKITRVFADTNGKNVWKFHAINVHDFAWTADPTYRFQIVKVGDIECIALAQENNAQHWQPSAQFLANVVKLYNHDFGQYLYPKIVAADAADGMEYPMITLDGGVYPSHQGLIAHEVGHNWFFGMLGSNETYRACMDEGFTQFLTAWSMKKLTADNSSPNHTEYNTAIRGYLEDAIDAEDKSLNTHSDEFENAVAHGGGYRHVYYKTSTMLYNLLYVLGDSLFEKAMKDYVRTWSLCHPYMEDFRNSITHSVKTDLNWFFDEWFESTKQVDYAIKKVKEKNGKAYISLKRKGEMQMPVDLQIQYKNGKKENITVPNSYFNKPGNTNTLPWIGWGKLRRNHTVVVTASDKIKNVVIDPSGRLADIYRVDNTWKKRCNLQFDYANGMNGDIRGNYKMQWRPDLWYNQHDGIRAGIGINGNYAMRKNIFDANIWYNTGLGAYFPVTNLQKITYYFSYENKFQKEKSIQFKSAWISGIWRNNVQFKQNINQYTWGGLVQFSRNFYSSYWNQNVLQLNATSFGNTNANWSLLQNNLFFKLFVKRNYQAYNNSGFLQFYTRTTLPGSDFTYSNVEAEWKNLLRLGKVAFKHRLVAILGTNKGNYAPESMLYASGASPEERFENKWTRDLGQIPFGDQWNITQGYVDRNLNFGGGLNLRGYAGNLIATKNSSDNKTYLLYRGNSGLAVNTELDLSNLMLRKTYLKFFQLKPYLFADAGIIQLQENNVTVNSGILADAGLGCLLNIGNWNKLFSEKLLRKTIHRRILMDAKTLQLRFDFPLFLNATSAGEEYFAFRWKIGIQAAF